MDPYLAPLVVPSCEGHEFCPFTATVSLQDGEGNMLGRYCADHGEMKLAILQGVLGIAELPDAVDLTT